MITLQHCRGRNQRLQLCYRRFTLLYSIVDIKTDDYSTIIVNLPNLPYLLYNVLDVNVYSPKNIDINDTVNVDCRSQLSINTVGFNKPPKRSWKTKQKIIIL
jgi:hypothetical protein